MKMKKNIIAAIITIMMTGGSALFAADVLPVSGTGSHNIDTLHPVTQAFDGSAQTFASFTTGAGEGWVEARFSSPSLIGGVEIDLTTLSPPDVFVEYKALGKYHPFMSSFRYDM